MNTTIEKNLPKGWVRAPLASISNVVLGQSPPSSTYNIDGVGLPFFQGKAEFGKLYPQVKKWCDTPKKIAEKSDVLLSVRAPVGPTNLCPSQACIGRGLAAIQPKGNMSSLFFIYFLRSVEYILSGQGTGTTFKAITGNVLKSFDCSLPPLAEQGRIVGKIEELFSDLDAGVAALEKVQKEIVRFRQSVLKHAFEGKLTAKWRKENKDKIEPASKLLQRIAAERQKQTKGKKQKKLPPLDTSTLPELPEGWGHTSITNLLSLTRTGMKTGPFGSLLKKYEHTVTGVPVLGIENIGEMEFVHGSKIHITEGKADELSSYDILPKDVLISRSGTVGEICVVPSSISNARFSTNLMRLSLNDSIILARYFGFLFRGCPFVTNQVSQLCKGSTRDFLNQRILNALVFPIAPVLEQKQIVSEIERRFSMADKAEKIVEQALKQAQRLRQSILKRAFEGKLVPQDPIDEPAEKLLERIKQKSDNYAK